MSIGIVPVFQGMSVWFVALERQFGWRRADLAFAFSLTRAEGSISGPVGGFLVDKLGPRRMVLLGGLLLGSGFVLFSYIQNLWQFYLFFILISFGLGLGTWLPMIATINNWFAKHRSMAMALATEGQLVGGIILIPILSWLVDPDADRLGWRWTAAGLGTFIFLVAFPLSRLIRNHPEEYGQSPDGEPPKEVSSTRTATGRPSVYAPEYTLQQALRSHIFWLLALGHGCTAIVIITISVHLGPMLNIDRGIPLQTVGWVVATYLSVAALFTLIGGYVGDRMPSRYGLFVFSIIQSLSMVVLIFANDAPTALLFGVLLGIGFGGRVPLTNAVRGVYFGRSAFGQITGFSQLPMNFLAFTIPLFAGFMADVQGSYTIPLVVIVGLSIFGSVCFLAAGEPRPPAPSRPYAGSRSAREAS
ncbi:MAG: MFS transporter [Dehalococcoidia bacterium]|nr:MFS transporter [Dehalococcoidia bacterium]